MAKQEQRYQLAPWGDVQNSDLRPMGRLGVYSRDLAHERHVALSIVGTYGIALGLLAIRCERRGASLIPISLYIADSPILVEPLQSNPRRRWDDGDNDVTEQD